VADTVRAVGELSERIIGVDVSSGVEENGVQSVEKIKAFIKAAKGIR
jgi:anthranilate synthase/indole-3-glycerol phosphate synthase/phosphoribosylanthranilate isomerase